MIVPGVKNKVGARAISERFEKMKSWVENFGGSKMTIGVGVSLLIGGAASVFLILQSAKLLR